VFYLFLYSIALRTFMLSPLTLSFSLLSPSSKRKHWYLNSPTKGTTYLCTKRKNSMTMIGVKMYVICKTVNFSKLFIHVFTACEGKYI